MKSKTSECSREPGIRPFRMNKQLKLWIPALLLIVVLVQNAFGQERQYPNDNFAITPPAGWDPVSNLPPQKGLVAVFGNPERTRLVVLVTMEAKSTDGPMDDRFVANFEKGLQKTGGGPPTSSKFIEVQGFRTYERIGSFAQGQKHFSTQTRLIATRGRAYSVAVMRTDGDATTDPEIQQCLASFRFLTPPEQPRSLADTISYRIGYFTGQILIVLLAIFVMVKLARSARSKKNKDSPATPPPLPPQPR